MSERKLRNNGTTSEVSLDKSKNYKYDKSGTLVEATTVADSDIIFTGSKSSLRRLSDLERNVSILATTLTTTDGTTVDADDTNYDGIFTEPARFKSTTRFDGSVSVNAAVGMNSNKITSLGTPTAGTDASTKGYVDSTAATAKSEAISAAATDATTKANAAKSEAISAAATDATTKANAAKPVAGTGIGVSGTTVTNTLSTSGGTIGGAIAVTGGITATGEITAYYSDARLKTNVSKIDGALSKVMAINGYTYDSSDLAMSLGLPKHMDQIGLMADEVEAVLPELVTESGIAGYKTIRYDKVVSVLVNAVKEQQAMIEELQALVKKTLH
jgi:hypothetical protein